MRIPQYITALIAAVAILALAGCQGSSTPTPTPAPTAAPSPTARATPAPTPTPTATPSTITVTDDVGRRVEIPYHPKRVAVTTSFMVELIMACGLTPVARPDIPPEFIYPLEAVDIPSFGVSHSAGPNLEQLAAARPDLVIFSPIYSQFLPSVEETLGVPTLVHDVTTVDDVAAKMRAYGDLLGCEEQAEEAAQALDARIQALREGLPETGPSVFAIFGNIDAFLGFMPATYLGDIVSRMGGRLITEGDPPWLDRRSNRTNPQFTPFSMEKVVERDPDVILVVRHGGPSQAREENFASLFDDPAWSGLRAVREGRIHEVSEWLYLRYPGPRVALALEEIRSILYPDG